METEFITDIPMGARTFPVTDVIMKPETPPFSPSSKDSIQQKSMVMAPRICSRDAEKAGLQAGRELI